MHEHVFLPFFKTPGIREGDKWDFLDLDGVYEIDGHADEIQQILALSNGKNTEAEIVEELKKIGHESSFIQKVLQDLKSLGVVVDSREQTISTHSVTNNPPYFSHRISSYDLKMLTDSDPFTPKAGKKIQLEKVGGKLIDLSRERVSCRDFSDRAIESQVLSGCLEAAYSSEVRPIPSGGGLYPLRLYVLVKEGGSDIAAGYYQYNHLNGTIVQYSDVFNKKILENTFNDVRILNGAPVIIVIAADLKRQTDKYANRGYRFTMLEAGHSAQNIMLSAVESNAQTLEYGGFMDDKLAEELQMAENERPLITIGLGYPNHEQLGIQEVRSRIFELVGDDGPISDVHTETEPETLKNVYFYSSRARYIPVGATQNDHNHFGWGTSSSLEDSQIKAIAEAYERRTAERYKYDIEAPANELSEPWISPDIVRPLTNEQLARLPHLKRFDETDLMQWVRGYLPNGSQVLVPVDLVYYPLDESIIGRKRVADADSSGMAAHTDLIEATKRATLELVERDATMRLWMSKVPPEIISIGALPVYFKKRADYWEKQNRAMDVLNLSENGVAVVHVIIRSKNGEYPYFIDGAAASESSFEAALDKAQQEAESLLLAALRDYAAINDLEAHQVHSPVEHGRYYHQENNKSEIEWLWAGKTSNHTPEFRTDFNILDIYRPIIVKLTQDGEPLQVVRAICPSLVPISFGFGNEYYTHPAVGLKEYHPTAPHFFA